MASGLTLNVKILFCFLRKKCDLAKFKLSTEGEIRFLFLFGKFNLLI